MPEALKSASVLIIVGFSLLVHVPGIRLPLLDYQAYRQTQTASMSRNYARHGMRFLEPELDTEGKPRRAGTEFPIYSYLVAILFKLFGTHDIWGRLVSALFAAWGALFFYGFLQTRIGEARAFLSALVMSVLPIHVFFTRTVQPESMALWGLLGSLYYLDRWIKSGSSATWAAATLLGAVAPLLKLPWLYLIFPLWVYFGWESRKRLKGRLIGLAAGLGCILALTAAWYHYARTAPVGVLPLTPEEHWRNLKPIFGWTLWKNHFIQRLPELCSTYPGLLLGFLGGFAFYKERRLGLWAAWLGITALYIVLLGQYGVTHRYTALPFAPICAVFIGSGLHWLWQKARWRRAAIILALGIPLHAALRIRHWYELEYPWVFEARGIVATLTQPDDLIITNTREHPVLLYHLNRYGFAPELEETGLGVLEGYRSQGARIFLTPTDESWARNPQWRSYFQKNARLLYQDPRFLIYRLNESGWTSGT